MGAITLLNIHVSALTSVLQGMFQSDCFISICGRFEALKTRQYQDSDLIRRRVVWQGFPTSKMPSVNTGEMLVMYLGQYCL